VVLGVVLRREMVAMRNHALEVINDCQLGQETDASVSEKGWRPSEKHGFSARASWLTA